MARVWHVIRTHATGVCWESSFITAVRHGEAHMNSRIILVGRRAEHYTCTYAHMMMCGPGVVNFISLLDRNHCNYMFLG